MRFEGYMIGREVEEDEIRYAVGVDGPVFFWDHDEAKQWHTKNRLDDKWLIYRVIVDPVEVMS